jgi:hypothetical protein
MSVAADVSRLKFFNQSRLTSAATEILFTNSSAIGTALSTAKDQTSRPLHQGNQHQLEND